MSAEQMGGGSEPNTPADCPACCIICVFLKDMLVPVHASMLGFSRQYAQDLISTTLDAIWSQLSCH